ncbi:MAG: LytTR family transcriptional regulator DNA-binding domain-containing protein [Bacteroidales bacterium]|nr:LytTR family transcriptional regulator DNA-binding domain-containing protein [Bacteroidales bacterium]
MTELQRPLPKYLTEKGNIVRLIALTAAFALIFINIYAPFGSETWFDVTELEYFAYSSLVILTGVMVVVVSRVIMYETSKKKELSIWNYLLWVAAEVFFMALFYTLYEKFILHDTRNILDLFKISAKNTALVLLLPYSVLWLYFSWIEKKHQLLQYTQSPTAADPTKNMIPFRDEKGDLRFSLKHENLLYIESADNYVNIYYSDNGKIARYMLRNTIKRLEEAFKGSEIVRCHRSYMVNFEKVKILRKDKDELCLELDVPSAIALPVSKTYVQSVMDTFTRFSLAQKE